MENLSHTRTSRLNPGLTAAGLLLLAVLLAACGPAQPAANQAQITETSSPAVSQPTSTREIPPTETTAPTPTATPVPASPTPIPPTATVEPPLAIVPDGLRVRCLPFEYDLPIDSSAVFASDSAAIRESIPGETGLNVNIPARACAVLATFNRPLEEEAALEIYQGWETKPWYSRTLAKVEDQKNTYYAILDHDYLVNHPYWNLSYPMKIKGPVETYWEGELNLGRAYAGLCWEGSMPDPINLRCPETDRLEREPHPDMPTFVPGGITPVP